MTFNFGKSFTRKFYPSLDNEPINLYSQAPNIYLFSTLPSLLDAKAGNNAFQNVTYWSQQNVPPFARTYTIDEIEDPDPNGGIACRSYFEAINFKLQSDGQIQTVIREIEIERVESNYELPEVNKEDLKNIYPAISSYLTDSQIEEFIDSAIEEFKLDLDARGLKWTRIINLKKSSLALAFKAISLASLSQFKDENDRFYIRYSLYEKKYAEILKTLKLKYDSDGDGEVDTIKEASINYYYINK